MKYELFDSMTKQHETMVATIQKLNKLAVTNVEKLVKLQMDALRSYSDLSLQHLKELAEVKNPQLLQTYLSKQGDTLKVLSEKVVTDAKAVADLGVEFNKEAQKIAQESFEAATKKAA